MDPDCRPIAKRYCEACAHLYRHPCWLISAMIQFVVVEAFTRELVSQSMYLA